MTALIVILVLAAVFVLLPGLFCMVLFVSIVWTHKPDLSVLDIVADIFREVMKEIKEK